MAGLYRPGLIIAALVSAFLALFLLFDAGLPRRADYTGEITTGGQRFAPETGAFAPLFEQTTLSDEPFSLAELRGNPVVLNFWATWCVPCRVEMPVLQQLYDRHRDSGLSIVGINLGEPEVDIQRWVESFDLSFDIVVDHSGTITERYYLLGQPSTYVIAPDGRVVGVFHGPVSEAQIQALLAPYL